MKQKYDVIVAGAGPAGLLAAKALAQNGFDVAVLERKADMSAVTRACGQSLLPPNEYFFGDLVGCQVIDANNQTIHGRVAAVHEEGGPSGLLELEDGLLIPFVKDICVGIHPELGHIEVKLPAGLVELFQEQKR